MVNRHGERQESETHGHPDTQDMRCFEKDWSLAPDATGSGEKDSGYSLVPQKGAQWKCHWVWKPDFSDLKAGCGGQEQSCEDYSPLTGRSWLGGRQGQGTLLHREGETRVCLEGWGRGQGENGR